MTVDRVDDCTFWYVNEYDPTTSFIGLAARIGAFKFPGCSLALDFFVNAMPASREHLRAAMPPTRSVKAAQVGSAAPSP